jgi:uncharacterized phosphosugar-binding protein
MPEQVRTVSSGPRGGDDASPGTQEGAGAASVFAVAAGLVARLSEHQLAALVEAGKLLNSRLLAGGNIYVFGTGHSRAVAMELAERAGGLTGTRELVLEDIVTSGGATKQELLDGTLERRPQAALELLKDLVTGPSDAFIVISHSGCNGAVVEMALQARDRGLPVVAITSLEHSRAVASRHPSGLRLFEVATLCLDTLAPYGDTAVHLRDGLGVCSVSSIAGAVLAQALTVEIINSHLRAALVPPVLVSRNLSPTTEVPGP